MSKVERIATLVGQSGLHSRALWIHSWYWFCNSLLKPTKLLPLSEYTWSGQPYGEQCLSKAIWQLSVEASSATSMFTKWMAQQTNKITYTLTFARVFPCFMENGPVISTPVSAKARSLSPPRLGCNGGTHYLQSFGIVSSQTLRATLANFSGLHSAAENTKPPASFCQEGVYTPTMMKVCPMYVSENFQAKLRRFSQYNGLSGLKI